MKTLILGIGNPVVGDDAVGIAVANKLKEKNLKNVDVETVNTIGLEIINIISGYDRVFVVDGVKTKKGKPGEIHKLGLEKIYEINFRVEGKLYFPYNEKLKQTMKCSVHDIDLLTVLKTGEKLGIKMPEIIIYGVEVSSTNRFMEGLSKDAEDAVPKAVEKIMGEL